MTLTKFAQIKKYVLYNKEKAFSSKLIAKRFNMNIKVAQVYMERLVNMRVLRKYKYKYINIYVVPVQDFVVSDDELMEKAMINIFK